jgi:ornithine carbamoyltransferase
MGQESEAQRLAEAFHRYQVNEKLFDLAKKDAIFLHCLPAHRGDEVTDDVIDSPRSFVFQQAENRLHVQKAIMMELMSDQAAEARDHAVEEPVAELVR